MLFDDNFIKKIPENPIFGINEITNKVFNELQHGIDPDDPESEKAEYRIVREGFYLVISVLRNFDLTKEDLDLIDKNTSLDNMNAFLLRIHKEFEEKVSITEVESMKNKFDRLLGQTFLYEFSEGDLTKIQKLINELRTELDNSKIFDVLHKQRLLKRLEKLQSELHKKMSDLDRFWGLIGDAGVALSKFGNDAKPIVDRIKEISDIVWRTQSRAEELPSDAKFPQLEDKTFNNTLDDE